MSDGAVTQSEKEELGLLPLVGLFVVAKVLLLNSHVQSCTFEVPSIHIRLSGAIGYRVCVETAAHPVNKTRAGMRSVVVFISTNLSSIVW